MQSQAYPASEDLDDQLRALVREPRTCLSAIAASDEEAASILQFYFSGYATLRRFYETRDEAIGLADGQRPRHKPLARRRAAAQALVAVIRSAADSIYGGLYDPDRDSAVQVDGLMALLGEALVFVHGTYRKKRGVVWREEANMLTQDRTYVYPHRHTTTHHPFRHRRP